MPAEYKPQASTSRLDQIMSSLDKAGITYINIKELFSNHKNDNYKLYWKTDSHWTDYGAYLVYKELFDHISKKFPAATPRAFSEFDWVEDYYVGGDMSYYLEYYFGYYTPDLLMKEYNVLRKPKFTMPNAIRGIKRYQSDKILTFDQSIMTAKKVLQTSRSNLPSAIVMRDSYSTQMYDILAERFNTTVYQSMWSFSINYQDIGKYDPDYLIYIIVERNLDAVFN
jgi:hypothetical protein